MPHSFFGAGETFGVRQLAAAFKRMFEKRAHRAVFKSGSKLSPKAPYGRENYEAFPDVVLPSHENRWIARVAQRHYH
jgi:hypothetical protein